jgi:hypothetical protein
MKLLITISSAQLLHLSQARKLPWLICKKVRFCKILVEAFFFKQLWTKYFNEIVWKQDSRSWNMLLTVFIQV